MVATEDFGAAFRRYVGVATGKACLACITVMVTGPALLAAEAPGELRVTVIDKDTRRPVEQAALMVAGHEGGESERRQTDEAGAVRLEDLPPGLRQVSMWCPWTGPATSRHWKPERGCLRVVPRPLNWN